MRTTFITMGLLCLFLTNCNKEQVIENQTIPPPVLNQEEEIFEEQLLEVPSIIMEMFATTIRAALNHPELIIPSFPPQAMITTCPSSSTQDNSDMSNPFLKVLTLTFGDGSANNGCSLSGVPYTGIVTITFEEPLGVSTGATEISLTASNFSFNGYTINVPGTIEFNKNGGSGFNYIFTVVGGDVTSTKTINGNDYRTTIPTSFSGQIELGTDANDDINEPSTFLDNIVSYANGPQQITCTNVTTGSTQSVCVGADFGSKLTFNLQSCSCPTSGIVRIYDPAQTCPSEPMTNISTDYDFSVDMNGVSNNQCDNYVQEEGVGTIQVSFCQ